MCCRLYTCFEWKPRKKVLVLKWLINVVHYTNLVLTSFTILYIEKRQRKYAKWRNTQAILVRKYNFHQHGMSRLIISLIPMPWTLNRNVNMAPSLKREKSSHFVDDWISGIRNNENSPIRGWGGLSKMSQKKSKMSIIELSQLGQDLFDFSDLKCLQTKSNYIDKFKFYKISHLTWPHPFTHP